MKFIKKYKEFIIIGIIGIILLFIASITKINVSDSSPLGIYIVNKFSKNFNAGDYILYEIPEDYKKYTYKELQKLDSLKKIEAVNGDEIKIEDYKLYINNVYKGNLNSKIPISNNQFIVKDDEVFTLSENPASLDGRYYGAIKKNKIKGKCYLIYTFKNKR